MKPVSGSLYKEWKSWWDNRGAEIERMIRLDRPELSDEYIEELMMGQWQARNVNIDYDWPEHLR